MNQQAKDAQAVAQDIKNAADSAIDTAKHAAHKAADTAENLADAAQQSVHKAADSIADAAQDAQDAVQQTYRSARRTASEAIDEAGRHLRHEDEANHVLIDQLANRAQDLAERGINFWADNTHRARRQFQATADATTRYVSDQPGRSVLIAAAAGAAIATAFFLGRSGRK